MNSVISIQQLSKTFSSGETEVTVLHHINCHIKKGELVAIIGPSGSGKSTLLTIMAGLQEPTEGEVMIEEVTLNQLSSKEKSDLRFNKIGFILQSSNLVDFLTVSHQFDFVDKVGKGSPKTDLKKSLMKRLDITHLNKKYPAQLSGGERQRVAIALALYHQPAIILADEPTASLDGKRAKEVAKLLASLAHSEEKGIVMVTHDDRLLPYCDRVLKIEDGYLTEVVSEK